MIPPRTRYRPGQSTRDPTNEGKQPWSPDPEVPELLSPLRLKASASRIRDILDPLVSREGPCILDPDDVLELHTLLVTLQTTRIPLSSFRLSRIHFAIADICGKATRWPAKLVNEADAAVRIIEKQHGPLKQIKTPLFSSNGRLHKVCDRHEVTRSSLYARFAADDPRMVDDSRAYQSGNLSFPVGRYWLNPMFAFREGMIDSKSVSGGICFDKHGAYAIVLRDKDEMRSESAERFTYRCRTNEPGAFRLTAKCHERDKSYIRVLRTHALHSLWAPVAGIRYDGMYKITGWTWLPATKVGSPNIKLQVTFDIHFERADSTPVNEALKHPLADELDDYRMYKIVIAEERERLKSDYHAWRSGRGTQPDGDGMYARRTSSLISKGKIRSARGGENHVVFADSPVIVIANTDGAADGIIQPSYGTKHEEAKDKNKGTRASLAAAAKPSFSAMSFLSLSD